MYNSNMRKTNIYAEKRDTENLTSDGNVLEKKSFICGTVVVFVAVSIFFYANIRMKTRVNIEALTAPAPAPVVQTKASLKDESHVTAGMNDKALSTVYHNITKEQAQQLSNSDASITNIMNTKNDKEKMKKVRVKGKLTNGPKLQNDKGKRHSKQLSNTNESISSINENQNDRDNLAKGRQQDITKASSVADDNKIHAIDTVFSHNMIVLIVAYMRTGSTLTGSIFQEYPDTFYVFEPIRLLYLAFNGLHGNNDTQVTLNYMNGTKRQYKESAKNKVILDEINSWLNCKLDSISKLSLTNHHHKQFTKVMKRFYICSKNYTSNRTKTEQAGPSSLKESSVKLDGCLTETKQSCVKAPLVVLKFIRLRMKDVINLLPLYPNMKIIHLVRDPRGILNSRIKIGATTSTIYQKEVQLHCSSLENDLKYSKEILKTYPNRLKLVQYEDLAERPSETARALVEFAGIAFVKPVKTFIEKQTRASRDAGCYTTQRRHSGQTAIKWRSEIDLDIARYTYNNCKTSNNVLGYLPLESLQALRNITTPSRKLHDVVKNLYRYMD